MSDKVRCECGSLLQYKSLKKHKTSKTHFKNMCKVKPIPKKNNIIKTSILNNVNESFITNRLYEKSIMEYILTHDPKKDIIEIN